MKTFTQLGSHNPLSIDTSNWTWRNPFNVLPVGIVVLPVISLVLLAI